MCSFCFDLTGPCLVLLNHQCPSKIIRVDQVLPFSSDPYIALLSRVKNGREMGELGRKLVQGALGTEGSDTDVFVIHVEISLQTLMTSVTQTVIA